MSHHHHQSSLRSGRNIAEVCPGELTNNRAELFAIIRTLEDAPWNDVEEQYCIGCFSKWHKTWERNVWSTTMSAPVGNQAGGAGVIDRSGR